MKTPARQLLPYAALAFFLTLTFAVFAQDNKTAPAPSDQPAAAPAAVTPAAPTPAPAPAVAASAETAAAPATEQPELRRLDAAPNEEAASDEDADEKSDEAVSADDADASASDAPAAPAAPAKHSHSKRGSEFNRQSGNERVSIWHDSTLAAGEYAGAVVSIFGSSTSAGDVGDAVVSILGSSTSSGDVGNAVVSVFGSTRVTGGTVGDAAVSVLGTTYINGHVKGEAVAVLGDVELGPKAVVDGDIVCVGGAAIRDPQSVVHGQINNVALGHFGGGNFAWLHAWVSQCLLYGRPLAFGPHLMWAWWFALGFLALYVVIALLFPKGVERCTETFEQRPGYSILSAFLTTLLAPLATILLIITIVGAPALIVFLIAAGIFGKAVMLAWIGRRITKLTGSPALAAPAVAVLIGGVLALGLYTVPFVGFIVAKLLSWLGVGGVVYTLILGSKRNKAAARAAALPVAPPPSSSSQPPVMAAVATPASSIATAGIAVDPAAPEPSAAAIPPITPPPIPPLPPVTPVAATAPVTPPPLVVSASTLLRAGFWIRLMASLLDAVMVGVAIHLLPHAFRPNYLLLYAGYCAVLWALKGTTVGGIVCGLKVVRLDDRPIDWPTALVRALGGFLSFIVAGLGFIWVAFDDHKQSWHDKIAGTTVVHVPRGVSLV